MTPDTPYAHLLAWAASAVFPHVPGVGDADKLAMARAVQQDPAVAQHVCGLEFHHDGSSRVDLFLGCLPRFCSFDGLLMPPWWNALLDACDRLDPGYLLQGGPFVSNRPASLDALAGPPQQQQVVLPDAHSLEFDHDAGGIRLAGLFQWLCTDDTQGRFAVPGAEAWAQVWGRLPLAGPIGDSQPWQSALFEQVRQQLGWPLWAGLMCGREDLIKLGFGQSQMHEGRLSSFLEVQGLAREPWLAMLITPLACRHDDVRISFDLDLRGQQLLPSVALECYPDNVTAETRSWELLDHLASRFALRPDMVSDLKAKLSSLPMGAKPSAEQLELQQWMPRMPLAAAKAAKLSHYKVSLSADCGWRLKSYVSLTWTTC